MFQDEARFGRISDTRYCWAKKPHRPMVKAMVTQQYTYAYGAVSPADGRFDSLVLPHVNGECMRGFYQRGRATLFDRKYRYGGGWRWLASRAV